MIAKGAARNNPRQLAVYLMRVERYSTGEPVELLELQSGWASTLEPGSTQSRIASRLIEAFRDWQVLTEGTQQGRDGLYHAEISPAPKYAATMTPEQWKRAAEILGEELGFKDQPRAIVLHGGTDGRKHMHIVWARTDVDAMKIISDGYNFAAHEKASHRMELEFGHDFVPGKHHKRDRSLQEEFPRQEFDFAEAQMAEREGKTVADRQAEIRALQAAAANGQEFKKALENAGYILAQGDRGYIVVDEAGTFSALSKNLQSVMKKAEVEAFMADVPLTQLPKIDEAKALQKSKLLAPDKGGSTPQASPLGVSKAERAALSFDERAEQVVGIRKSCDNALAFKNALETDGYILAKGDQRGFVLVDGNGKVLSLSKLLVDDIKGKQYKAFMAPIERRTLPSVEEAKAIQERRHQEAVVNAEKRLREASKFLTPLGAEKTPEPIPGPEASKFLPKKQESAPESKFLRPPEPEQAPVLAPAPAPAEPQLPTPDQPYYRPMPPEGWTERRLSEEFEKATAERRLREQRRAVELRAEIEQKEIAEQAQKTVRRAPLPSDPWMAQVGGVDKLSPAHLASAKRSYDAWDHKDRYDFSDYVSYVQKQWERKELPPAPQETPGSAAAELSSVRQEIGRGQVFGKDENTQANTAEYNDAVITGKRIDANRLEDFDLRQHERTKAAQEQILGPPKPGWRRAIERIIDPVDEEKKRSAEQEELEILQARQAQERRDYVKKLEQDRARELEALRQRQLQEQATGEKEFDKDLGRHTREKKRALELQRELEAEEREKQLNREKEEGLEEGKG